MSTSVLTSRGQTTIPKDIRDALHAKSGDTLVYVCEGDRVVLQAVSSDLLSLKGILKDRHTGGVIDFARLRDEAKAHAVKRCAKR